MSNNEDEPFLQLANEAAEVLAGINASSLNAFCSTRSSLPAQADRATAASLLESPLGGLPIAVKEIIDVAGMECARGCDAFAQRIPDTSASVVQTLEALGAQVVGITRSTELAIARATKTQNPFAPNRSPGASSSGSAAAVGGGLVPFALGSQTIGSTIRPAAYCGVVGFKPSHGIVPLNGVMPLSPTLDHLGFLAKSVTQLNAVISWLDDRFKADTDTRFRFLFADNWFADPVDNCVVDGINRFRLCMEDMGFECGRWSIDKDIAICEKQVTDTILVKEMADYWSDSLYSHGGSSDELRDFLSRGQSVSDAQYSDALSQREAVIHTIGTSLETRDIVVAPSVTGLAPFKINGTGSRDPQRVWTLAGMPALSLPIGRHQGLPLAVQLIAKRGGDATLISAAHTAENVWQSADRIQPGPP